VHVSILSKSLLRYKCPVTSFRVLISACVQTWGLQGCNFGKTLFLLCSSTMPINVTSSEPALSNPIPTLQNNTLCAPFCAWVCLKHNQTASLENAHKYLHYLHSTTVQPYQTTNIGNRLPWQYILHFQYLDNYSYHQLNYSPSQHPTLHS
jgi:hypothetical protein